MKIDGSNSSFCAGIRRRFHAVTDAKWVETQRFVFVHDASTIV